MNNLERLMHLGYYEYATHAQQYNTNRRILYDYSITSVNKKVVRFLNQELFTKGLGSKIFSYSHYNDEEITNLISEIIHFPTNNITLTAGAENSLQILVSTLANKETVISIITPTFSRINLYPQIINVKKTIEINTDVSSETTYFENIKAGLDKNKDINICILTTPVNPSGIKLRLVNIVKLLKRYPHIFFILDMAILNFIIDAPEGKKLQDFSNYAAIFSFSKTFGIPGIRLGFFITANKEVILATRNIISPFLLSSISLSIAKTLLKKISTIRPYIQHNYNNVAKHFLQLQKVSSPHLKIIGAGYLNCILELDSKPSLFKALLKKHILTVDLSMLTGFQNRNAVRINLDVKTISPLISFIEKYNES